MKRITHIMLVELEACPMELADFDREWPAGASVTRGNFLRAGELGLDIHWLARRVLTGDALTAYVDYRYADRARKVYSKTLALAFWRAATGGKSK